MWWERKGMAAASRGKWKGRHMRAMTTEEKENR